MDVTERKQVEKELESSLSLLRATLESTADGILVVDTKGRIVSFNRKFLSMWGIPNSIIELREDRQTLEFVLNQLKNPEAFLKRVRELYNQPDAESYDVLEFKDSRIFERYSQPQRVGENILGRVWSFRDVTERKRAEQALRESNQFNKDIISTAGEGIIVYDSELRYVVWNRFMEKLSGMPAEQVIGKYAKDLFPHLREKGVYSLLERALAGETVSSADVDYYVPKTGKSGWVSGTYAPYRNVEGEITGVIGLVRDITDRKRAEKELGHRVSFGKLISSLSTHFINLASDGIDDGINYALKTIGEFAGVDRSYIFLYRDDGKVIDNTHEWCAPGIEPQISRLQGLPVDAFPWIMEKHKRGELVYIPRVSDLPPEADTEKEEFESEGIRSLIAIALMFGKSPMGFVGFDSVREEKTWDEETIELLKIVGEMFSNALAHRLSQEAIKGSFAQLSKKNRYEKIISTVTRSVHQSINLQDILENAVESMGENIDVI